MRALVYCKGPVHKRGCSTPALQALRHPVPGGISHRVPRGLHEELLPTGCLCPQTGEVLASALGGGGFSVLLSFIVNEKNIKYDWMSTSRNMNRVQKQPLCLVKGTWGDQVLLLFFS